MPDAGKLLIVGVGAAAVLAALGYFGAKAVGAAIPANALNPLSPDNVVNRAANSIFQTLTGNPVDTLGTSLASGGSDAIGAQIVAPVPIVGGHAVAPGPADSSGWTLGTWLASGYADSVGADATAPVWIFMGHAVPAPKFGEQPFTGVW